MPVDKKTREHTEGVATAVQAKHGDSCSVNRVNPDSNSFTSFSDNSTEPQAFPCLRVDALVGNGTAAPKSCLSVSLTLENAHTNSRSWLTPRRHNLYNVEDHLRPAISLVLPARRDKFEDFNSISLVLQHFLEDKQPANPLLPESH